MLPQHPTSPSLLPSSPKPSRLSSLSTFATYRAQNAQLPSPARRKPLPAGDSTPQSVRYSSAEVLQEYDPPDIHTKRSLSVDSPTIPVGLGFYKPTLPPVSDDLISSDQSAPASLNKFRFSADQTPIATSLDSFPTPPSAAPRSARADTRDNSTGRARHDRDSSSEYGAKDSIVEGQKTGTNRSPVDTHTMPNYFNGQHPTLEIPVDEESDDFLDDYSNSPPRKPKSPGEKLTSFFSWSKPRQSSIEDHSSTTTFSERAESPFGASMSARHNDASERSKPSKLDIPKANAQGNSYFNVPGTPLLSLSPHMNAHVEELERELKNVSSELAESIRREMELEDEVERWKAEMPAAGTSERRTSDYYSDSGASSARYPFSDSETKMDELEKLRRKAEQEKAQIRSEMAARVQDELRRRRDLEAQVQQLEEQLGGEPSRRGSEVGRVQEVEAQLDDARRRLSEERQVKENFEDLLAALQKDLELHRNERDNLRDEVVPALKARVEGLEAQAAEAQGAIYEMSRVQQQNRFRSIAEEGNGSGPPSPLVGLSRSNSLARHSINGGKRGSLTRSTSVKEPQKTESKEVLSERVKDIEEQRDALHRALKHLIMRQDVQAREHAKKITLLERERDAALNATPRRTAFHQVVTTLRDEVNTLRRRADDALDQKWQVEKGLGGLRMDLDRAQQETSGLRIVLQQHDIAVPEITLNGSNVSNASLDKAFRELQTTYALSLARIKEINAGDDSGSDETMNLLLRSISDAEAERDAAQKEAERYRSQARALQQSEVSHLGKGQSLASDLYDAAQRMDELSGKVEQQIASNQSLRERLTRAVARGEEEQKASTARIIELERKLKAEEDVVMSAQTQSEDVIARHEDEVKALKESYNSQLQRLKAAGLKSPNGAITPSPMSPLLLKSPRLDKTSSGPGMSFNEAAQAESLEKKVVDLEKALREADREMEEVVGRMNKAQIEVGELQTERDEAIRQTRKLQAAMQVEREAMQKLLEN